MQEFKVTLTFTIDGKAKDDCFARLGKVDEGYIREKLGYYLGDIEHPGVDYSIDSIKEVKKNA